METTTLRLKPTHKAIRTFYQDLSTMQQSGAHHEGAVAPAFAALLRSCASQLPGLKLVEQYSIKRDSRQPLRVDGAILDRFELRLGVWEAKDSRYNRGQFWSHPMFDPIDDESMS